MAVAEAEAARAAAAAKVEELEEEVAKLAGQQNLNQRIQHHAKIKDEVREDRISPLPWDFGHLPQ